MAGGRWEGPSSLSELWVRFCRFLGLLLAMGWTRENMIEIDGRERGGRGTAEAWKCRWARSHESWLCLSLSGGRRQAGDVMVSEGRQTVYVVHARQFRIYDWLVVEVCIFLLMRDIARVLDMTGLWCNVVCVVCLAPLLPSQSPFTIGACRDAD
jgi:hypothetical protein